MATLDNHPTGSVVNVRFSPAEKEKINMISNYLNKQVPLDEERLAVLDAIIEEEKMRQRNPK